MCMCGKRMKVGRFKIDTHSAGYAYSTVSWYEGSELVCRSVLVDLRSDDALLDARVEVYNCARGFTIDYRTGAFW